MTMRRLFRPHDAAKTGISRGPVMLALILGVPLGKPLEGGAPGVRKFFTHNQEV